MLGLKSGFRQSWAKCIWPIQDTVSRYIFGYLNCIQILFWEKYCICILSEISKSIQLILFFKKLCRLKPALNFALSKLGCTDFKYETYPSLISIANGFYKLVCLTLKIELETNDDYVQILNNKDFLLYISEFFCIKIVSG